MENNNRSPRAVNSVSASLIVEDPCDDSNSLQGGCSAIPEPESSDISINVLLKRGSDNTSFGDSLLECSDEFGKGSESHSSPDNDNSTPNSIHNNSAHFNRSNSLADPSPVCENSDCIGSEQSASSDVSHIIRRLSHFKSFTPNGDIYLQAQWPGSFQRRVRSSP